MDLRLTAAILLAKTISKINKLKGTGGTAAPGLCALKIDPNLVRKLSTFNNLQSIIVSGTNGKTTTARLISTILEKNKKLIHNRQGSNLLRGIASTLIENSSILGKIDAEIALWEADEAALVEISSQVNPDTLVLLNLFRDQLDRYGEINTIRTKWQSVVKNLPKMSTLVLNSDDPSVNYLKEFAKCKTIFFGLDVGNIDLPTVENVQDIKYCIKCANKLTYTKLYSAHLGIYHCTKCGFKRNEPNVKATDVKFKADYSSELLLTIYDKRFTLNYPLPGLYNAYNVLAAISVAVQHGTDLPAIKKSVSKFRAAFGRFQSVKIPASPTGGGNKSVLIFLIKNPAGANEVIRTIAANDKLNLLLILNDNIADGRDVSWIWDTNWEVLSGKVNNLQVAGSRASDLANRLKYAGFKINKNIIKSNVNDALQQSLDNLATDQKLIILPTYTALLEIERAIETLGGAKWHDQ